MHLQVRHIQIDKEEHIQIPRQDWDRLMKQLKKMKEKLSFEKRFRSALHEINDIESGKKQPKSMQQFLNEL